MEKKESKFKIAFNSFKENAKRFLKKQNLVSVSVYIIFFSALFSLIITPIHVDALYQIYSEISGFAMFCFVLLGLIGLFCSTRLKKGAVSKIMTIVVILATCGAGAWLISIYVDAIYNQLNILESSILLLWRAIIFSVSIIVLYLTSVVMLSLNVLKVPNKANNTQAKQDIATDNE